MPIIVVSDPKAVRRLDLMITASANLIDSCLHIASSPGD